MNKCCNDDDFGSFLFIPEKENLLVSLSNITSIPSEESSTENYENFCQSAEEETYFTKLSNENNEHSSFASPSNLYFVKQRRIKQKSMAQDAEDGPDFLNFEQTGWDNNSHLYNASSRPPMNQDEFDKRFSYRTPHGADILKDRAGALLRYYYRPCLSSKRLAQFFLNFFPILKWLPNYEWRNWFASDIIGGLVTGVMHVPQGIAYAQLAGVDAVVGLYTSFFPPLFYMFFGTSRHNSIGSFAVVALMSNVAMNRLFDAHSVDSPHNISNNTSDLNNLPSPIIISSTLAFCIGLVTLAMGILRLDMISTYFSDQVVAGFTTGASIHVFAAQLKHIFGIHGLPIRSGAGNLIMKFYDICKRIPQTHIPTFTFSIISILFLCFGKEFLNPLLKRRFNLNVPIPFELLLMVFGTFLSFLFHGHSKFGLAIVDHIPTGIPQLIMPDFTLLPELLPDAIVIATVVIAVHISLAKIIAKKKCYRVDPGQELFALGFSSTFSSFFQVYPVSCSLGRTLVNVEANTKTQLSAIFSCAFLAAIILYFGQWLRTLPMCILSSIIIVALKGIFRKIADLRRLWPLSRIDFAIWLVSFVTTVCWDVSQGLVVSIGFALLTTVFRTQWPRWHFLANLSGTNDFRDAERYELITSFPGICIFRFDSPLLFTNVDNFKETIHKAFHRWKRYQGAQLGLHVVSSILRLRHATSTPSLQISTKMGSSGIIVPTNLSPRTNLQQKNIFSSPQSSPTNENNKSYNENEKQPENEDKCCLNNNTVPSLHNKNNLKNENEEEKCDVNEAEAFSQGFVDNQKTLEKNGSFDSPQHLHFIVDCSGFTFVDCMGVNALKEIFTEMRQQRVRLYFAAAKATVRDLFEKCGFYEYVPKRNFYPTIRDAVALAKIRRSASQILLDESTTQRVYDEIETMQKTQPEQ